MPILKNLSVRLKLALGFSLTTLLLCLSVGISLARSQDIEETTRRVVELRVPTSQASLMMQNGMNHSLAALRGWMLRAIRWAETSPTDTSSGSKRAQESKAGTQTAASAAGRMSVRLQSPGAAPPAEPDEPPKPPAMVG